MKISMMIIANGGVVNQIVNRGVVNQKVVTVAMISQS